MSHKFADCAAIFAAMQDDGFLTDIQEGGPELDRVKAYLRAFANPEEAPAPSSLQYPDYPLFPGIRNRPFHEKSEIPGIALLESEVEAIRTEWQALGDSDLLRYSPASMQNPWRVHLLRYMGVDMEPVTGRCPRTHGLLRALPGTCFDYPWADALFSVHAPQSHLKPHCSVDNLRVRCHLALRVPSDCRIRVGRETRRWTEGEALLFEDSFEHEVWNESDTQRAILIVDFWHPDLTEIEQRALTAGFARSSVRRQFMFRRLQSASSAPTAFTSHLREQMSAQEELPERRRSWRREGH